MTLRTNLRIYVLVHRPRFGTGRQYEGGPRQERRTQYQPNFHSYSLGILLDVSEAHRQVRPMTSSRAILAKPLTA
jgi:hypothetical protein